MREMPDYTTAPLNQAAWLVYINGIEIPAMGVVSNWGVWQMPTATIQMVPHPMLQRIGYEDRLQIAVFYLDEFWDSDNPQFCLHGEFEVVGWSYNNSGRGRAIQLECVSHDQILEQLHFYYISSIDDITGSQLDFGLGITATKLLYPACLFMEGLTTPIPLGSADTATGTSQGGGYITRPIDFVANIFRSLLSEVQEGSANPLVAQTPGTLPDGVATAPGKNFFARWMKMTKYHRRWCALPEMEDTKDGACFPILKAVQETQLIEALQEFGQTVGDSGSAWDLLRYVFGLMFMEIAMIPSPAIAVEDKTTGVVRGGSASPSEGQFMGILSHFVKPQCIFSLPPTCNIVFPSMLDNYAMRESYITQPTRVYLTEEFISNYLAAAKTGSLEKVIKSMLSTGAPAPIRKRVDDLASTVGGNNKACLVFPEEFFKGPVAKRLGAPPWLTQLSKYKETTDLVTTDPLNSVFDAYAEYELYRARYAERQGGANLAWNPYIVPGFPMAVFDELNAGCHTMGYVQSITQTMQATGTMSTSIGLTYMRTLPEFLGILGDTSTMSSQADIDIAPIESLPDVSNTFQKLVNAQKVYTRLFYQGKTLTHSSAFDWKSLLKLKTAYGKDEALDYAQLKKDGLRDPNNVKVVPEDNVMPLFQDYGSAMRYVARPVCTLKEYVEAYHGKSIETLISDGTVQGEYKSFYSVTKDKSGTKGATFWGRIFKLLPGPGTDPGIKVSNIGPAPDYAMAGPGELRIVDRSTGMPETRQDWDKILLEYRKIVRSEEGMIAPQR
jgi:hypothetical protein